VKKWYQSRVKHGDKDGSNLSYPTVNLDAKVLPSSLKRGVYASWVKVGDKTYPAAAHFGPRLIKKELEDVLEIYILDFSADIYGEEISFYLEQYIREVMDFIDFSSLKNQITLDIEKIKEVLKVDPKEE
jgi:riboflavin kinase / FMN adenylyltransferase